MRRRGLKRQSFGRPLDGEFRDIEIDRNAAVSTPCDLSSREGIAAIIDYFQGHSDVEWRMFNNTLRLTRVPFRDLVIRGGKDHLGNGQIRLLDHLRYSFSEWRRDFRVRFFADHLEPVDAAYFGFGVFAPADNDPIVADLDFSIGPDGAAARAYLDGEKRIEAGWYDGQMALAVGFCPGMAAAHIDLNDLQPPPELATRLHSLKLLIGRSGTSDRPEIRAFRCDPGALGDAAGSDRLTCRIAGAWWRIEGWQQAGIEDIPLRLCWTNRIGSAPFMATSRLPEPPSGRTLRVCGLVVPDLQVLPIVQGGGAHRWWIDFDDMAHLRSTELAPRRLSLVGAWGNRLALFHHIPSEHLPGGRWQGYETSIDGWQMLRLARNAEAEVSWIDFKGMPFASNRVRTELQRVYAYSRSLVSLTRDGQQQFGFVALPSGVDEFSVVPDPWDVWEAEAREAEGTGIISLDWLNRAAKADVGHTIGLAERWFNGPRGTRAIHVRASDDALQVTVSEGLVRDARSDIEYDIAPGDYGMLGPLYIQYNVE